MHDFREILSQVRTARTELEALVGRSGREGSREVTLFMRRVFAHLMRADGSLSSHELRLLSDFNRDGFSWHDEVQYAKDTIDETPRFLHTVPLFLHAAIVFDQQQGTRIGSQMVEVIQHLCELVVHCDGSAEEKELQAMSALLSTCTAAVELKDILDPVRSLGSRVNFQNDGVDKSDP